MSKIADLAYTDFVLPASIVTKLDVARLLRETERVDNELTAVAVHKKLDEHSEGASVAYSAQLAEFLEQNNLNLENTNDRSALIKHLRTLKDKIPTLHMTFAVTADPESLQRIVAWVRESVHPQAVIAVGLQPSLVAGVYLRTPNHVHDLSLRSKLKGQHSLLVKELEALRG